jgi:hypothetical protein
LGAGPTALAIRHSGESAVAPAVRAALGPFTGAQGRITLPGWYRVVLARGRSRGPAGGTSAPWAPFSGHWQRP